MFKNPMAEVHNEKNHAKQMAYYLFFFRRLGVKDPRHPETISGENFHYLDRKHASKK